MRILLISLFYSPLNFIAARRIENFSKYLKEFGHEVDVLTRHYPDHLIGTSDLEIGLKAGDDIDELYYEKGEILYVRYSQNNTKIQKSNRLLPGIKGLYNLKNVDVYHYSFVENGIKTYSKKFGKNPHDLIIASSPPPATLLLAEKIKEKYGVGWIADFRDSHIFSEDRKLIKRQKGKALNQLLKSASGILFVSEGMREQNYAYFNTHLKNIPYSIIYNGFDIDDSSTLDQETISQFEAIQIQYRKVLLFTGSIYPERNLDFYLEALRKSQLKDVAIVGLGIQEEFRNKLEQEYSDISLIFLNKTSYATSIELQNRADFLLLTIWKNCYTGFSGKVFEYLYSGNNVMLDYLPPVDLEVFLKDFNNIWYCNESYENFHCFVTEENTQPKEINSKRRNDLSRKAQIQKLDQFIQNLNIASY